MTTSDPNASCAGMRPLLSGLLDHELEPEAEATIRAHLAVCEGCRIEKRFLEALSIELRRAGRRIPAPPSWEKLARLISERGKGATLATFRRPGRLPELVRPSRLALLAAAALGLLLVIGVAIFERERDLVLHALGLRPAQSSDLAAAGFSPEIITQLLDTTRRPDLARLGRVLEIDPREMHEVGDQVAFTPLAPASLPEGYELEGGWVIASKVCRTLCLRYLREGRAVVLLQSPSGATAVCRLTDPQCCLIAGIACRRSRTDRLDVVQTTRNGLALTVAAHAGEADIDAVVASLIQ